MSTNYVIPKKKKKPIDPSWYGAKPPPDQTMVECAKCGEALYREYFSKVQRARDEQRLCLRCANEFEGSWDEFFDRNKHLIPAVPMAGKGTSVISRLTTQVTTTDAKKVTKQKRIELYIQQEKAIQRRVNDAWGEDVVRPWDEKSAIVTIKQVQDVCVSSQRIIGQQSLPTEVASSSQQQNGSSSDKDVTLCVQREYGKNITVKETQQLLQPLTGVANHFSPKTPQMDKNDNIIARNLAHQHPAIVEMGQNAHKTTTSSTNEAPQVTGHEGCPADSSSETPAILEEDLLIFCRKVQLSELATVQAMFDNDEFTWLEGQEVAKVHLRLHESMGVSEADYKAIPSDYTFHFRINIRAGKNKRRLSTFIEYELPISYPYTSPRCKIVCNADTKGLSAAMNEKVRDYIGSLPRDKNGCLKSTIYEVWRHVKKDLAESLSQHDASVEPPKPSTVSQFEAERLPFVQDDGKVLQQPAVPVQTSSDAKSRTLKVARCLLTHRHSLDSRNIRNWAVELEVGCVWCTGALGIVLIEGTYQSIGQCIARLKDEDEKSVIAQGWRKLVRNLAGKVQMPTLDEFADVQEFVARAQDLGVGDMLLK
ncbi:hypothetical protein HDU85_005992 [Gaertneriomyces sp. JEL0708]|nr:hypothetical protein HDU85_005992 [Gaertneriomyces sp. JEL0708]